MAGSFIDFISTEDEVMDSYLIEVGLSSDGSGFQQGLASINHQEDKNRGYTSVEGGNIGTPLTFVGSRKGRKLLSHRSIKELIIMDEASL